jgi:putative peptidoglycan lipid II flippase
MNSPARVAGRGVFRTALLLLPLQASFRGGEAVLPLLLAAWFGRSDATDLYYLLSAYFVFSGAVLTGAFQDSSVVPVLIEVERTDPDAFGAVAGSLLGHTLVIGGCVAVAMGSLAVGVSLAASRLPGLAVELAALMAAGLVVAGVRAFYVGLLNARARFAAHPIASGLGMGLTIGLVGVGRGALGVRVIPLAVLLGEGFAVLVLSTIAKRAMGAWVRPHLARPPPVLRIWRLVRMEVTGSLITRINPVIDQLTAGLAAVLGGGTLLRYATDVASLPTSVLQATVLPVLLTTLARDTARPGAFFTTTRRALGIVVLLMGASAAAIALGRAPLCRLLFLHGVMDEAGVARIAAILPWAMLGVAPFGALLVLARAHVARQNSRIMPSMGLLNAGLNLVLNLAFVGALGLAGIALSTSITYLVVALVFWLRLRAHRHA